MNYESITYSIHSGNPIGWGSCALRLHRAKPDQPMTRKRWESGPVMLSTGPKSHALKMQWCQNEAETLVMMNHLIQHDQSHQLSNVLVDLLSGSLWSFNNYFALSKGNVPIFSRNILNHQKVLDELLGQSHDVGHSSESQVMITGCFKALNSPFIILGAKGSLSRLVHPSCGIMALFHL